MSSPAMMVLPAPGSSASRKRSGWRGQHVLVDGGDLVRQRIDDGGVDRQHRVEQMGQPDALRFGHQPEQRAVAVEAPGPALLDDLEPRLVVAVEQLVGDLAGRRLVGQLQRLGTEPLDADHGDQRIGQDAADGSVGLEVFELHAAILRHTSRDPSDLTNAGEGFRLLYVL